MTVPTQPEPSGRNNSLLVSVAVVLPRQAAQIEERIEGIVTVLAKNYEFYELLLVDNGSPFVMQARVQELQRRMPNLRLLRLSRAYSREVAIAAALDHCIGDYVVTMDLTVDPPDLIPILVTKAAAGFDAVVAECQDREKGLLERTISIPVYRMTSRVLGFPLHPDESYFRVFSRRLVNSIVRIRSRNRYLSCLNGIVGFQQCSVVYHKDYNPLTDSARVVKQLLAVTDILVSNSAAPLRLASILGVTACAANVAYLGYIFAVSLIRRHLAEGWLTTSLTQTTMFLMVFLILSILSEYVARLLDETKEQPLYFVEFETSSAVVANENTRLNIA